MDTEKKHKDPKAFATKHWHKINGILTLQRQINNNLTEFVITKQGKNPREIRFIVFNQEVKNTLQTKNLKERIKVKFTVKSRCYNDKYYTDLIAEQITEWKKESKKEKVEKLKQQQQDMFDNSNYAQGTSSMNKTDYNTDEWTTPKQ